jgi:hypothetical protein
MRLYLASDPPPTRGQNWRAVCANQREGEQSNREPPFEKVSPIFPIVLIFCIAGLLFTDMPAQSNMSTLVDLLSYSDGVRLLKASQGTKY